MGLVMLFPKDPLLPRVLITACDVFFVLLVGNPLRQQLVKLFEWLITVMVRIRSSHSFLTSVLISDDAHSPSA